MLPSQNQIIFLFKAFLTTVVVCFAVSAHSVIANWVRISANNSNLIYHQGESAEFSFDSHFSPKDSSYRIVIEAEAIGLDSTPVKVELRDGYGFYETPALVTGNQQVRFVVKLVGPAVEPEEPEEQLLEEQTIDLEVF